MPALIAAVHDVNDEIKFGRQFLPVRLPDWVPTPGAPAVRAIAADDRRVRLSHHPAASGGGRSRDRPGRPADPCPGSGDRRAHGRSPASRRGRHHAERRPRHRDRRDRVDARAPGPEPRGPGARARRRSSGPPAPAGPSAASLPAMDLLGRVFRETLRLYPPAWGFRPDRASRRTRSASTRCRRAVS